MMLALLPIAPIALALLAFAIPQERWRPWLVPLGGMIHAALTTYFLLQPAATLREGWLVLDPLGRVLLGFLSLQFLICSFYVPGYLSLRAERPNRIFCAALLVFIGTMSLTVISHHLGLMWVAIETTALISAPLIYFNQNARSLEATWKYILIGSVGVALALFGSFLLSYSALYAGLEPSLLFEDLVADAPHLSHPWLNSAFVVLLVGYGTKVGLAPMHSWKPDAYGEAPGLVGALLAGGLTSCAFFALLRFLQILNAAGDGQLGRDLLIALGLLSMGVAAIFMARQRDYKRMLAYSSIEHMGIIAFGLGLGATATYGALLHLIANGLGKGVLFLSAGNIHRAFGSKHTDQVSGALRYLPISGALLLIGFFAITGSPPFALFLSELTIVNAGLTAGRYWEIGFFLLFLAIVFMGMAATIVEVVQGTPPERLAGKRYREPLLTVIPTICFALLVLALGLYIPSQLDQALHQAASFIEVTP